MEFILTLLFSTLFWNVIITEERESLNFKLSGAKDYDTLASRGFPSKHAQDNLGSWGHEFVRSLAGEIGLEYNQRVIDGADPDTDEPFKDLLSMVQVIVPFHVTHNAEAEAVDLLIEVQRLKILLELDSIDANNYQRICLYLMKTANYMSDPDDLVVRSLYYTTRANIPDPVLENQFTSNLFYPFHCRLRATGNVRNRIRNLPQRKTIL